MKIWIVAPFCSLPREPYFNRFLYLAQLAGQSHTVHLITSRFRHFDKKFRTCNSTDPCQSFSISLIAEPGYRKNVSISRIISHRKFTDNFKNWFFENIENECPDLIVSAYPLIDTNVFLGKMKTRFPYKLIIDIQDIWPESIFAAFPKLKYFPFLLSPITRYANKAFRSADALIAVSKTYLDKTHTIDSDIPRHVTYIGADIDLIRSIKSEPYNDKRLRFFYIGTLSHSYDMRTVVEAFKRLPDEFELHVFGTGPDLELLKKIASLNTFFYGVLSFTEMISKIKPMDIAINPICASSLGSITNKISDYIALEKPIISSQQNQEVIDTLNHLNALSYSAGDVDSFITAANNISRSIIVSRKNSESILLKFDRAHSYPQLLRFIESVAKR